MSDAVQTATAMADPSTTGVIEHTPQPPANLPDSLIVRFDNVGKSYRRFDYQPFLLRNLIGRVTGRAVKAREFWPLRHVSFDIRAGETVGVIGRNGAGKSTLLRLVAGACYPTEGTVSVRGRIAPLLALGAGFHPDMTGRECVEVNGTALGLTRNEIRFRMADILAFAEIGDFLDMPVRYYSSGMLARLGFSVAIHTDPDLLIVDEVLAVGDHAFHQKCIARFHEIQRSGTTILFVSHDENAVRELCDRAIWLCEGQLRIDGPTEKVVSEYIAWTEGR